MGELFYDTSVDVVAESRFPAKSVYACLPGTSGQLAENSSGINVVNLMQCTNFIVRVSPSRSLRLESRAADFLPHAFLLYPDRDYCVLTLPSVGAESVLLRHFSPVPARSGSAFNHVLYVMHRWGRQGGEYCEPRGESAWERHRTHGLCWAHGAQCVSLGALLSHPVRGTGGESFEKHLNEKESKLGLKASAQGIVQTVIVNDGVRDTSPAYSGYSSALSHKEEAKKPLQCWSCFLYSTRPV